LSEPRTYPEGWFPLPIPVLIIWVAITTILVFSTVTAKADIEFHQEMSREWRKLYHENAGCR
jgi:hypothetical protein